MQMNRSGMNGCCVGTYFYDLGGAHSKYRAKNIEEFAFRMIDLGYNQINTAATNTSQGPERKFLEELNFKEVFHNKNTGMHLHVVAGDELEKALAPFRLARQKKYEEEQAAKRAAMLKAQEAERKKQEEIRLAAQKVMETLPQRATTDNTPLTLTLYRTWLKDHPLVRPKQIVDHIFGANFGRDGGIPNYERYYDDAYAVEWINVGLTRRATTQQPVVTAPALTPVVKKKVLKKRVTKKAL